MAFAQGRGELTFYQASTGLKSPVSCRFLAHDRRRALREIVETAEVVRENGHTYLVARVSAATLHSLATFETSREDMEEEPDAEKVNEDGTDEDGTNESSLEWSLASGGSAVTDN